MRRVMIPDHRDFHTRLLDEHWDARYEPSGAEIRAEIDATLKAMCRAREKRLQRTGMRGRFAYAVVVVKAPDKPRSRRPRWIASSPSIYWSNAGAKAAKSSWEQHCPEVSFKVQKVWIEMIGEEN